MRIHSTIVKSMLSSNFQILPLKKMYYLGQFSDNVSSNDVFKDCEEVLVRSPMTITTQDQFELILVPDQNAAVFQSGSCDLCVYK